MLQSWGDRQNLHALAGLTAPRADHSSTDQTYKDGTVSIETKRRTFVLFAERLYYSSEQFPHESRASFQPITSIFKHFAFWIQVLNPLNRVLGHQQHDPYPFSVQEKSRRKVETRISSTSKKWSISKDAHSEIETSWVAPADPVSVAGWTAALCDAWMRAPDPCCERKEDRARQWILANRMSSPLEVDGLVRSEAECTAV